MRKSAWYVILLLVLLVVSVSVSIYAFTNDSGKDGPDSGPVSTLPPISGGTPGDVTVDVQVSPSPTPVVLPTMTPNVATPPPATPKPTPTPTPKPTPTPTPAPTPTPLQNVSASGSFASNSGTGLNLQVDWSAYTSGGTVMLKVNVSASHYSFYTSELWQAIELTVNGQKYSADSKAVSYDGSDLKLSPMASFDVPAAAGSNSISVVWNYKGSYSGVQLDAITASGNAYIG